MISFKLLKYTKIRQVPTFIVPFVQLCEEKTVNPNKVESTEENKSEEKQYSAAEKLNKLLSSMKTVEDATSLKSVDIPKAGGRQKEKNGKNKKLDEVRRREKSQDIIQAAKDVANLMGEDKKKIESELLAKLLNHTDSATSSFEDSDGTSQEKSSNLKNIIYGMKIDNSREDRGRAEYVREAILEQKENQRVQKRYKIYSDKDQSRIKDFQSISGSVNLFGEDPLGIFTRDDTLEKSHDCLKTWEKLEMKEQKLAITHPPANYFEKMALWTEQGKLWVFPIDNEQGLENQEKVDFSEHIFLEQHLESWCPKKGPIRHFMELVCVGLSKNPYITAQEKKEHILWYENYFEQKKDILKDIIIQQTDEKNEQKQLENK